MKISGAKIVLLLITVVLFSACSNDTEAKVEVVAVTADTIAVKDSVRPFRQFITKFKMVKFPFTFEDKDFEYNPSNVDEFDKPYIDNLIYGCYALLPDTSNFFAVIVTVPADDVLPRLMTFDKSGNRISDEALHMVGTGGFLCGSSSTGKWRIDADFSIICSDTVRANECDSLTRAIPGKVNLYYNNINGKIMPDGKIVIKKTGNVNR